jgi:hypothetical protein
LNGCAKLPSRATRRHNTIPPSRSPKVLRKRVLRLFKCFVRKSTRRPPKPRLPLPTTPDGGDEQTSASSYRAFLATDLNLTPNANVF